MAATTCFRTSPSCSRGLLARIANGRVVSAASAHRAAPPRQTQRAVWDRVAQAAERGATFPHRHFSNSSKNRDHIAQHRPRHHNHQNTGPTPGVRKLGVRKTGAWSASITSVGAGGNGGREQQQR